MAYIISIAQLPLSRLTEPDSGGGPHHVPGPVDGPGVRGSIGLPPKGISLDNAAYPPSAGWIPIKTAGQPALEAYSSDPGKDALAQSWRVVRYSTNAQNSYQPPAAYWPTVSMETTNKPISGGGEKDVGFRKIAISRIKVEEDRS